MGLRRDAEMLEATLKRVREALLSEGYHYPNDIICDINMALFGNEEGPEA